MKSIHKYITYITVLFLIGGTTACKKYLDENNPGGRVAETYFNTAQGFEDLVKSNYSNLRPIISGNQVNNYGAFYWLGTDIFTTGGTTDVNPMNLYSGNLNSSIGDVDAFWKTLYAAIGVSNTTLYWSTQVTGMNATTLNYRIGEARALRAFYYFLLTETWGDVPLVLTPATEPGFGYARAAEKDVYTQIIQDLTDAAGVLPATTTDFGRVTKGMAQHLLAKVYLQRAYKSYGGGNTDYQQAVTLSEAVITSTNYSLKPVFADLFDPSITNFQVNPEVIFSVQFSSVATTNTWQDYNKTTYSGNYLHNNFIMDMAVYPAISRSAFYNKAELFFVPTPYFFTLFDKTRDARYLATCWNAIKAQVASGVFAVGDTVIYFPDVAWTATQKAAVKYYVYNPDEYRNATSFAQRSFPSFKKFRETGLAFGDGLGTRDTYVFRLGETYLIAAEAYLKLGNMTKALQYYNAIRSRAAKPGINPATSVAYATEMQAATITIDDILNERARELSGEELRWFELKRTGKLISQTLLYNEEAKAAGKLDAHNLLRPIPQSQIDLNRGTFAQNTGY